MTTTQDSPETSVLFSLTELARIEEERVREEELQEQRRREERGRRERQAAEQRRAREQERIEAEAKARDERERERAEAEARRQAREQAAVEVARIEAEAKARLAADDAVRAHELAVLRAKSEGTSGRLRRGLVALVALLLAGGLVAGYGVAQRFSDWEREVASLRDERASLVEARDRVMRGELAALERRRAELAGRGLEAAGEERALAEAAQRAIESHGADEERLDALRSALDAWRRRCDALERFAALDARRADLASWAAKQQRDATLGEVRSARLQAQTAPTDEAALRGYREALDALADALAAGGTPRPGGQRTPPPRETGGQPCSDPNDPLCDLNGQRLDMR